MKPLLVTSGEPAGIGPDICLSLANSKVPLVVLGNIDVLEERAHLLNLSLTFKEYKPEEAVVSSPNQLTVLSIPCPHFVVPGQLDAGNASYVLDMLTRAAHACSQGEFSGLVTAPVHKAIINEGGVEFTGHTEFFKDYFQVKQVVMMLACDAFKVALVTTHLALSAVSRAITGPLIIEVIRQLHLALSQDFGIQKPAILVAGLNPHAGESGYLGREEIDVIEPAIHKLQTEGLKVTGPFSADTLFSKENIENCDAFVTMYHDQGLPVLKYAGFGQAVNITLGLPIIRTSVDHGTALHLAGKKGASATSLLKAVEVAAVMAKTRAKNIHD